MPHRADFGKDLQTLKRHLGISITTTLISLAGVTLLYGCGGGGNGGGGTRSGEFVGRLTSVVNWKMPDEVFAGLTPKTRAALLTKGITIDNNTKTMTSKELPLAGHWVKIGDRYCMTDKEGIFTVEGNVPSGSAPVVSQIGSTDAEGLVQLSSLVPKGQTPTPVRISLSYSDSHLSRAILTASGRAQGPDGCSVKEGCLPPGHPDGNKKACCLNYDGPEGDGTPRMGSEGYTTECRSKALDNFINSTNFAWIFSKGSRPCRDEEKIGLEKDEQCWFNHRYRNCQNIVEGDVNAPAKIRVPLGGRVTFTVRNNTESNATWFTWKEKNVPGAIELEKGVPSEHATLDAFSAAYILQNFSIARKEHYENVTLAYKAPEQLPGGKATATYHLSTEAGGYKRIIEIVVGDVDHVELTPPSDTIKVGETTPLTAVAKDSQGKTVNVDFEWSASNGAVSVSDAGLVTGQAKGQSVVTVRVPGTDLRATSTIAVEEDEEPAKVLGVYKMTSANGEPLPYIVNEYYDEKIKYTFRQTIFSGSIELYADGKFKYQGKGGEYKFPITLSGEGTFTVNGHAITLNYTSGSGPKNFTAVGAGKLSRYQVYPKDSYQFPKDVPVTEIYTLQK